MWFSLFIDCFLYSWIFNDVISTFICRIWSFKQRVLSSCHFISRFQHSWWALLFWHMESWTGIPSFTYGSSCPLTFPCSSFLVFFFFFFCFMLYNIQTVSLQSLLLQKKVICPLVTITFLLKFQVPNGIGTILGIVQLALYFNYKETSGEESRDPLIVSYA